MEAFTFPFVFQQVTYEAACQPFALDGTTELHLTPHDPDLFHRFGIRLLARTADGSISTALPPEPYERDYLMALAEGVSAYFDDQPQQH